MIYIIKHLIQFIIPNYNQTYHLCILRIAFILTSYSIDFENLYNELTITISRQKSANFLCFIKNLSQDTWGLEKYNDTLNVEIHQFGGYEIIKRNLLTNTHTYQQYTLEKYYLKVG